MAVKLTGVLGRVAVTPDNHSLNSRASDIRCLLTEGPLESYSLPGLETLAAMSPLHPEEKNHPTKLHV
jgi:hypothetical protein